MTAPPRANSAPRPHGRVSTRTIVTVLTVLAAGVRLYRLRYGYAHGLLDYDSGVYLGSALDLIGGHLPYRDVVLVHPPVITVLMTPPALLAKVIGTGQAMGLAKILTGLAGAASVPLTARLVRGGGRTAVVLAGGFVAFQGDAVASGYNLLLEPWLVLFCLLGAVLVFDGDEVETGRRLVWGGVLFGVAGATKIWAVAPVLALVLALLPRWRVAARFLTGVAAGFLVPVLPFLLLAPGPFVHQVFVVQLFRTSGVRTPFALRLLHLLSVSAPNGDPPSTAVGLLQAGAVLLAVLLVAVWLTVWLRARLPGASRGTAGHGARRSTLERFAVLAAVLVTALLLSPDTFYWHYAAFSTPFLAVAAVLPLTRLPARVARAWAALLVVCLAGTTFTIAHRDLRHYHVRDEYAAVSAVVPQGACVVSSNPAALIADDRFVSDRPGCPALLDSFGTVLDLTDGESPSARALRSPAVRALWLHLFQSADYLYLQQRDSPTVPTDGALRAYLHRHFHLIPIDTAGALYARNGLSGR